MRLWCELRQYPKKRLVFSLAWSAGLSEVSRPAMMIEKVEIRRISEWSVDPDNKVAFIQATSKTTGAAASAAVAGDDSWNRVRTVITNAPCYCTSVDSKITHHGETTALSRLGIAEQCLSSFDYHVISLFGEASRAALKPYLRCIHEMTC